MWYTLQNYPKGDNAIMETPIAPISPIPTPAAKTNVLSIVSLVAGILGFLSTCVGIIPFLGWVCSGIGGLFGIAALVLGFLGMNQVKKTAERGKGMAIAGIVLGGLAVLGICVTIILNLAMGPVIGNVFSQINSTLTP
jgi:hypothetical protein